MDSQPTNGSAPATERRKGMALFGAKGPGLFDSGTMSFPEFDADDQADLAADGPRSAKLLNGNLDSVLFRGDGDDGYSLVRTWFAPHYVLPRHTHDADCLYYVAEGELTMGNRTVKAGEGFFVPAHAPYGYDAGPEGVVVLEFRMRTTFDMKVPGGQADRLRRMNAAAEDHGDEWAELQVAQKAAHAPD
ncbi:MAG TPA: hypothetical protein VHA73_09375 [Acidimicrobiales bacterium]|jgi:quercetin dioxygenase-like cupin family protein|nr:hypothetical protein [Acidimicrobiales bacterium]